jgi:hypothetical protein
LQSNGIIDLSQSEFITTLAAMALCRGAARVRQDCEGRSHDTSAPANLFARLITFLETGFASIVGGSRATQRRHHVDINLNSYHYCKILSSWRRGAGQD